MIGLRVFNVVIADDDDMIRGALFGLLDDHPGLTVVGTATNGRDAAALCSEHAAHLVVLDVRMPFGGVDAVAAVRAASPDTVIAFYTVQSDRRTRQRLIEAGAAQVFAKGAPIDLASELHALVAGSSPPNRSTSAIG